jgi:hypothetical protein
MDVRLAERQMNSQSTAGPGPDSGSDPSDRELGQKARAPVYKWARVCGGLGGGGAWSRDEGKARGRERERRAQVR